MEVTNNFGVPETLMSLARRDYYSKGKADYSVTELLAPPRVQRLRKLFHGHMKQDVSQMLWQLMGSALHVVAERGQAEGHITEERLFTVIDGVTVSGAIDIQRDEADGITISDYKFTSAWAVMNEKPEWEQQQNIYAWLVRREKKRDVKGVQIIALIRDWNRREAERREDYPKAPIQVINLRLWSHEETEQFVRDRIAAHNTGKLAVAFDEELPLCTEEDRWVRETKFAVMKEGRKRAVKLFDSEADAKQFAEQEKGFVETRKGEAIRCTGDYCGVSQWCSQYQAETKGVEE
jgi:hypothetical protein